ncbi:MAG: hypothetical protein AABX04_08225 [Nanoarchaeota archaeon]
MDHFEERRKRQEIFLKEPRKSIQEMISHQNNFPKNLTSLPIFSGKPALLKLFLEYHREYASLIGKMMEKRSIHSSMLIDDTRRIMMIQRMSEMASVVGDYKNKTKDDETAAIALARAYASSLESFWNNLRRLVWLAGLKPKKNHLNVVLLKECLKELEGKYSISLAKIKSTVDSRLRNSIDHEDTFYQPPNIVVFLTKKKEKLNEIDRLTTEEIYTRLVEITIINLVATSVENTAITSWLEQLLKLSDQELEQLCKTGIYSEEMLRKMENH